MIRNRSLEVHAGWGLAVSLALLLFGVPPVWAFAGAFAAGAAVEAVQWAFPCSGQATWEDVIYTGIGGLAGALMGLGIQ